MAYLFLLQTWYEYECVHFQICHVCAALWGSDKSGVKSFLSLSYATEWGNIDFWQRGLHPLLFSIPRRLLLNTQSLSLFLSLIPWYRSGCVAAAPSIPLLLRPGPDTCLRTPSQPPISPPKHRWVSLAIWIRKKRRKFSSRVLIWKLPVVSALKMTSGVWENF